MYTHRVGVCLFCSRVNCTVSTHIGHTPMVSSCLVWVLLLVLAPKFLCGATSFNNTIEATCSYVGLVVGQLVGAGMRSRAALEPKKSSRGCAPAPRLTVPSALRAANPSALLSRPVSVCARAHACILLVTGALGSRYSGPYLAYSLIADLRICLQKARLLDS